MAENTTPRLMAAAKEFNIGKDTLIDFLISKGFNKDDLKPTSKLSEDMYFALQAEFQSDKVAKLKSDQIDLPKGSVETRKKKEEEEVNFAKTAKKAEPKNEPEIVVPAPEPLPEPEPVPEPVIEKTPEPEELPVTEEEPAKEEEPEIISAPIPEIEGPKVFDKIDLSKIDSSTRPKKSAKKPKAPVEEPPVKDDKPIEEPPAEIEKPAEEPVVPEAEPEEKPAKKSEKPKEKPKEIIEEPIAQISKREETEEEAAPVITNLRPQKLTGPKILGKIELPTAGEQKPRQEEKRKRKRIPIERKNVGRERKEITKAGEGGAESRQPGAGGRQGGRTGGRHGQRQPFISREQKEIDKKEIQDKIKETQAKLAGTGNKKSRAKQRRLKREELENASADEMDSTLQVTEFISVSELASLMDVNYTDVISKCMSLGLMVSINQRLDAEVIELVAGEFGFDVEFIDMQTQLEMEEEEEEINEETAISRSPIITIMGHVDHGKTSLLDYIRSANVVGGEAGGITQHIGAYVVTLKNGKNITFLDTPGHEAFTAMRARGAKVTDVAVIVIAADDAVMPQTKEAISHAQAAGVPMVFAINKIDKEGANPQKIYEQLSAMNILVEEWGGKFQSQEISAKQGLNVDALLEKILLEAELLNLKCNPEMDATGTIVEASLDKGRGYVATVLVHNGTLKSGDIVVSGQYFGKVKAMFNERNKKINEAPPSSPALILGLNGAPQAGEKFKVIPDESEAKSIANRRAQILREQGIRTKKHITLDEIGRRLALGNFKELNLIIKGDVDGSVEALSDSLQKLSTAEIAVNVILKGVGAITESDVNLATASDAIIVGFNVRATGNASKLAEAEGVQINTYSIIYTAIEEIKSAMEGMLEPKIREKVVANVEVRNTFKFDKAFVAGCYVLEGKIHRNSKIRVIRDGIVIYPKEEGGSAELASLKRFKDDVKEVASGMECGIVVKNFNDIQVGDIIEAFEEEEVKRTL